MILEKITKSLIKRYIRRKVLASETAGYLDKLKASPYEERSDYRRGKAWPHNGYRILEFVLKENLQHNFDSKILAAGVYLMANEIAGDGLPALGGSHIEGSHRIALDKCKKILFGQDNSIPGLEYRINKAYGAVQTAYKTHR
jgi:hypothetical protein